MKINQIKLTNFKRFTELSLNSIPDESRLVVLIGPNGCGKSSVFDSFEQIGGRGKPNFQQDQTYLRKNPEKAFSAEVKTNCGDFDLTKQTEKKHFYIRSAYRMDPDFQTNQIGKKDDILGDSLRPKRLIDVDKRVQDNYERLVGSTVQGLYSGEKDGLSVSGLREELIGKVGASMKRVFDDLILEGIGDPFTNGQFYFTKGISKNFPYKNISAGEKGAFDIILDLIIKSQEFNDTVFVIDEPELHMHSRLQQRLLIELFKLVPDNCQLWLATHSIGFIKGAIELRKANANHVSLFDFDDIDFDNQQILEPIIPTPDKVRKIFSVALDDLSNMVTPSQIIFCEGSQQQATDPSKREFDSRVFNTIFSDLDVLFLAADNKSMSQRAATFLLKIVTDSGAIRTIKSLVDRDQLTDEQIKEFSGKDATQHFLSRRTIENFLFDSEIIDKYCSTNGIAKESITSRMSDNINDDAKAIQSSIMQQSKYPGSVDDFKLELAKQITNETEVYNNLKKDISL